LCVCFFYYWGGLTHKQLRFSEVGDLGDKNHLPFFIQTIPLISAGVWIVIIYGTKYSEPLDSYRSLFSGWFLHALPLFFFFLSNTNSGGLVILAFEGFVMVLNKQAGGLKYRQARYTIALVVVYVMLSSVVFFLGNQPSTLLTLTSSMCDVLAVLWIVFRILSTNKLYGRSHPSLLFFFKLVVNPSAFLVFIKVYSFSGQGAPLLLFVLWSIFFLFRDIYSTLGYTPSKAYTRIHKIAMFEDAPEAEAGAQPIALLPFNSNILVYVGGLLDVVFVTLVYKALTTAHCWHSLSCFSLLAYSL
jgi:hypothetical protein